MLQNRSMHWQNKTRPNKTTRVPYAHIPSEEDPLFLIPETDVTRWVETALDHLNEGHNCRRVAGWLVEKTSKKILKIQQKFLERHNLHTEFLYLTHPTTRFCKNVN